MTSDPLLSKMQAMLRGSRSSLPQSISRHLMAGRQDVWMHALLMWSILVREEGGGGTCA